MSAEPIRIPVVRGAGDLDLPVYQSAGAAGMDLLAAVDGEVVIEPGERAIIHTGISVAIPGGYEGQVRPRSGLAAKWGVTVLNAPGTIDSDYRGEIKVVLANLGVEAFVVSRGARIAQLVVAPVARAAWDECDALPKSFRGDDGFGSTGFAVTYAEDIE
ncbi:MAG: dUTP diphosphatase [Proteobacteria bacterium]|nr:dUTP diphosphatase [Pseudomonadota bacterium]MDA1131845.1 dUTP diphosphatase [Pseudomonadota bacterium]